MSASADLQMPSDFDLLLNRFLRLFLAGIVPLHENQLRGGIEPREAAGGRSGADQGAGAGGRSKRRQQGGKDVGGALLHGDEGSGKGENAKSVADWRLHSQLVQSALLRHSPSHAESSRSGHGASCLL